MNASNGSDAGQPSTTTSNTILYGPPGTGKTWQFHPRKDGDTLEQAIDRKYLRSPGRIATPSNSASKIGRRGGSSEMVTFAREEIFRRTRILVFRDQASSSDTPVIPPKTSPERHAPGGSM